MKRSPLLEALTLAALTLSATGCVSFIGGPIMAWEGEPYGMVRTDWKVITGNKQPTIASELIPAPLAAYDLPLAFAVDTALLPLALIRRWS